MDIDMMVYGSIEHIFELQAPAAMKRVNYW